MNTVKIIYGEDKTLPVFQWDYGQVLVFEGFGELLPDTGFQVHFANTGETESVESIGTAEGVTIPDSVLENGNSVVVWVFLHTGDDDGETEYRFLIPIVQRAKPPNIVVPPAQEHVIDQALAALSAGVARAETAADHAEVSETAAGLSADAASRSEDNALAYAERAESAEDAAQGHAEDAQEAEGAAQGYAAAAADSARDAETAADRAEQAATTAGYLDMYIDEDGYLCYVRTSQVSIDFDLDEYGYLVMKGVTA